jgi:hypothetical protein
MRHAASSKGKASRLGAPLPRSPFSARIGVPRIRAAASGLSATPLAGACRRAEACGMDTETWAAIGAECVATWLIEAAMK